MVIRGPGHLYQLAKGHVDMPVFDYAIGISLLIWGGIIAIWGSLNTNENDEKHVICPNCKEVFERHELERLFFSKGNVPLENPRGFYKRRN